MRFTFIFSLCCSLLGTVWAQPVAVTGSASPRPPATLATPASNSAVEPLVEQIRVEDRSVRIDEVRVGGQTRSIDVQPKGTLPAYQIAPATGERSWKVLDF